jgi:hypothetical protein
MDKLLAQATMIATLPVALVATLRILTQLILLVAYMLRQLLALVK